MSNMASALKEISIYNTAGKEYKIPTQITKDNAQFKLPGIDGTFFIHKHQLVSMQKLMTALEEDI